MFAVTANNTSLEGMDFPTMQGILTALRQNKVRTFNDGSVKIVIEDQRPTDAPFHDSAVLAEASSVPPPEEFVSVENSP